VGDTQLLARVEAAAMAAQSLSIEQICAGEFEPVAGPAKPVDGFP
jgi:hypothetical protein